MSGFPMFLGCIPRPRRQLAKWRRARQFHCLVAQDAADNALLGALTLSVATPEAQLPPPLPTKSPLRAYVSNMSVAPQYRRRGIATSLLQSCERIGALARCCMPNPHSSQPGAGHLIRYGCMLTSATPLPSLCINGRGTQRWVVPRGGKGDGGVCSCASP